MKLKVTGLKQEMSTTGTGASFAAGSGEQYASPKAFKIRKDEIGEPFTDPNPSIPNRPSKFIDYKQLFEDAIEELYSPIKDMTSSQSNIGDNSGYDMDTQDAASVLELAQFSKGEYTVGDTETEKGTKYTVTDVDPETGRISWDVEYVPAFDSVYKEFDDLRKVIAKLDQKTDDKVVDDIAARIKTEFNRYRTHIRKNYPEEYKKFTINEASYKEDMLSGVKTIEVLDGEYSHIFIVNKDKATLLGSKPERQKLVLNLLPSAKLVGNEVVVDVEDIKKSIPSKSTDSSQPQNSYTKADGTLDFEKAINYLSQFKDKNQVRSFIYDDEAFEDLPTDGLANKTDKEVEDSLEQAMDFYFGQGSLNEARYSQFKKQSQFRTPTQQLHMAVREIRRKIDEITKVVSFTERMRTELKASNEGMSYLNRTREAITKINEKLQELNNRIKGLTE